VAATTRQIVAKAKVVKEVALCLLRA